MTPGAAPSPFAILPVVLAAVLAACGPAENPPARPVGEQQALDRAETMLQQRVPDPAESPAAPTP